MCVGKVEKDGLLGGDWFLNLSFLFLGSSIALPWYFHIRLLLCYYTADETIHVIDIPYKVSFLWREQGSAAILSGGQWKPCATWCKRRQQKCLVYLLKEDAELKTSFSLVPGLKSPLIWGYVLERGRSELAHGHVLYFLVSAISCNNRWVIWGHLALLFLVFCLSVALKIRTSIGTAHWYTPGPSGMMGCVFCVLLAVDNWWLRYHLHFKKPLWKGDKKEKKTL